MLPTRKRLGSISFSRGAILACAAAAGKRWPSQRCDRGNDAAGIQTARAIFHGSNASMRFRIG
jgi:hypothetical protein